MYTHAVEGQRSPGETKLTCGGHILELRKLKRSADCVVSNSEMRGTYLNTGSDDYAEDHFGQRKLQVQAAMRTYNSYIFKCDVRSK